ncbi:Rpn family recombination-promoting nuclease/putative transposase [Silvanigrella aquatica]|uniref:Transposase n=1 Tax=Silvanigrella aquatica TaxID=1915309 RepID=A0A1L4D1W4_9BACT|nr:Rpn family recombination-promoting nuclease/putative transposase [Silvanigrella aquatica]APJ04181.1 hypothetical protein AXG55_09800 [Silvanigrella aquatica]
MENIEILDVKNDYIFKRIFGENENIFIDFVNSILNQSDDKKIKSVTFLNNEINKDSQYDKESRLDVLAQLNNGSFLNLEMQMLNTGEYEKRCLYYWAKLYEQQLSEGKSYRYLCPSICIHVLNFNFFKEKEEFITNIGLLDKKTYRVFSEDLEFVFLEVPKVPKNYYNNLDKWMHFLRGISKKEVIKMNNPNIQKAFEALEYISQSPIERGKYEARQKYLHDFNTAIETKLLEGIEIGKSEGVEIGITKGKLETAKKLKSMGLPINTVIEATGLTADELEKI